MMRGFFALALVTVLTVFAAGCGDDEKEKPVIPDPDNVPPAEEPETLGAGGDESPPPIPPPPMQ